MGMHERELDGGLRLRAATHDDVERIVALEIAAFGAEDEPGVRTYLTGAGTDPTNWTVVVDPGDGGRVVAASALLPLELSLDDLTFAAGQIEYVATDPAYQRRGLVRAQFDWHHERADQLGQLAQFIGGIPYFYRKFGYGYGLSYPDLFLFDPAALRPDPGVTLRPATDADVGAFVELERLRPRDGVRFVRDEDHWRRWIAMAVAGEVDGAQVGSERFFVAERAGSPVGWSSLSVQHGEHQLLLLPAVTVDAGVTDAVIAHAIEQAGQELVVVGHDTPGSIHGARVRELGTIAPYGLGIYVRIPDPIRFLDLLRPVLSARLSRSRFVTFAGSVGISLYNSGLEICFDDGIVTEIRDVPGIEDPFDIGECGVAPDWLPALVLGRFGAQGLEQRADDVTLGSHGELLEVLFPRLDADVVGDF